MHVNIYTYAYMYIYKYMSNLQTYIYSVHLLGGQPPLQFSAPCRQTPPPHPTHSTIYTKLKSGRHTHTYAHTRTLTRALADNTNTHSTSPVGILLYVIIRGGCTIEQARVQWLALLSPSKHPGQRAQRHLLLLLLTLLVLQVLHGLKEAAEAGLWSLKAIFFGWGKKQTLWKFRCNSGGSEHILFFCWVRCFLLMWSAKLGKKNKQLGGRVSVRRSQRSTHKWSSAL